MDNMFAWVKNDTHPPFYYMALLAWLHMGDSVFVLRSLSACAMTIAAVFVYLAARILFGRPVALMAMILFVVSPHCLLWAQKARPYAFQTMWIAIAFWGMAGNFLSPIARRQFVGGGLAVALRSRSAAPLWTDLWWLAYAVGGGLAMLSQHPAGFFVLGCNVAVACVALRDIRANRIFLVNWVVVQLVLTGIWLLWFPAFLEQFQAHLTPANITGKHQVFILGASDVAQILVDLFSVAHLWKLQTIAAILYAGLALFGIVRLAAGRVAGGVIFMSVAVPIIVCLLGFFLLNPIFGYVIKTFNWIVVPYVVFIALAISALKYRLLQVPIVAAVLLLNIWGVKSEYEEVPPRLDRIADIIAEQYRPEDGAIFSTTSASRFAIAYYLRGRIGAMAGLDASSNGDQLIRTPADAAANRRNWVLFSTLEQPAVDVASLGTLTLDIRDRSLILQRYDRRE